MGDEISPNNGQVMSQIEKPSRFNRDGFDFFVIVLYFVNESF